MWKLKHLLTALFMLLTSSAMATEQTYHWTAPPDGGPVHHYEVQVSEVGGEFITLSVEPVATTVTLDLADNVAWIIRVRGVGEDGTPGGWSLASEPYARPVPGTPGQPWRDE